MAASPDEEASLLVDNAHIKQVRDVTDRSPAHRHALSKCIAKVAITGIIGIGLVCVVSWGGRFGWHPLLKSNSMNTVQRDLGFDLASVGMKVVAGPSHTGEIVDYAAVPNELSVSAGYTESDSETIYLDGARKFILHYHYRYNCKHQGRGHFLQDINIRPEIQDSFLGGDFIAQAAIKINPPNSVTNIGSESDPVAELTFAFTIITKYYGIFGGIPDFVVHFTINGRGETRVHTEA